MSQETESPSLPPAMTRLVDAATVGQMRCCQTRILSRRRISHIEWWIPKSVRLAKRLDMLFLSGFRQSQLGDCHCCTPDGEREGRKNPAFSATLFFFVCARELWDLLQLQSGARRFRGADPEARTLFVENRVRGCGGVSLSRPRPSLIKGGQYSVRT